MTLTSQDTLASRSSTAGASRHSVPTIRYPMTLEVKTPKNPELGAVADMAEPFLVTQSRVEKVQGLERRGVLFEGTEMTFGVHGAVKAHYGLEAEPDLPLPVDYLVTAAGG